jgi:hypothetical protein
MTSDPMKMVGSFSISWAVVTVSIDRLVNNFLDNSIISSCLTASATDTTYIIHHR